MHENLPPQRVDLGGSRRYLKIVKESFSPRPDPLGQPFIKATPSLSPLWLFCRNLTGLQSRSALLHNKSTV